MEEFEKLYEEMYKDIIRYIYVMSKDYGLAEDIAQDTLLKAFETIIVTNKILNKSWFYTVARNKYISVTRKGRFIFWGKNNQEEMEIFDLIMDENDTPEEYVLKTERNEKVQKALTMLCESYRTALILREYHELNLDEISNIMGVKSTYTKQLLYKARKKFKEIYGGYENE